MSRRVVNEMVVIDAKVLIWVEWRVILPGQNNHSSLSSLEYLDTYIYGLQSFLSCFIFYFSFFAEYDKAGVGNQLS